MSSTGTPAPARSAAEAPAAGPDWKWQVGKMLVFYLGFQAVVGPNGLLAWYQGKTQFQGDGIQPAPLRDGDSAPVGTASNQNPFSVPAASPPRVPSNATTTSLFGLQAPLDFYVFITAQGPPTEEELTTQFSSLVPDAQGPRVSNVIDFSDPDYASLLQDPLRKSLNEPILWSSSKKSNRVLAGVRWTNISMDDDNLMKNVDLTFDIPKDVQTANASLWAEIYATPMGSSPSNKRQTARMRKLLTRLYPERKEREEKSLFSRSKEEAKEDESSAKKLSSSLPFLNKEVLPIITHWHPNLTLALVKQDPGSGYPIGKLPPPVLQWVHVAEEDDGQVLMVDGSYTAANYPIIFANDFWHLREHMNPINDTRSTLPLHINLYTTSFFKFQMLAALTDSFNKQPGMASGEIDMIKRTLLETAPWYLAVTVIVSILHSIFEFLAFSSDVTHWKDKKNMAGVSLGTILTNIVVQVIILLYLLDQSQDTSWMILASQGIGIVIEAWKLTKAVTVSVVGRKRGEGVRWLQWVPYRIDVKDKHVLSEEEKKTQEFDKLAFRIVAWGAAPLLVFYTIYSAVYDKHKGAWSFTIGTLCSFVYAFGFVSLIPQLIVNYKLKSTAGMSSKVFVFKILGTFVDDLFAFAIKMPLLHRLACFRDDLVFMVFLYQRWAYGVDDTRVNEYGQVVDRKDKKDPKGSLQSSSPASATAKLSEAIAQSGDDVVESKKRR
ncbi:hypothetical protein CBS101457_004746 [Exobasidium rhododendri]|nr:hypothetical protein CBS101457_004746 [Exobasidium rhododendri]